MTDKKNPSTTEPTDNAETSEVAEPNRLQKFVHKHPRAAKIATATAVVATALGAGIFVGGMRKNGNSTNPANPAPHELEAPAENFDDTMFSSTEDTVA